ncbi:Methyltransferase type 12 [Deinococcus proteolyticus MRP]|uniref:Methyltransferase type 12 n=1 Tax=Deinococcus proteolyticus (strain ATCC 35074 / DSM 20540 / JCM 6276 / NBRC 101906 / NCIMB 13154 / VKM Ac-1939 / CCM 2703 / MRP) TaxID=693977 RepID=F0RMF4_DEIPM|nr:MULTISPECIES: class I SAM-dependent methyltransferase [Deinococcus]ADY27091.1 Methyltransferase type 12 [Deinococcus proteolyticus MRP]MCY1703215.1 class I SAM-dependent methyltransferase [Deinococcus sp. SL84]
MTLSVTDPHFGQQPMSALLPALRRALEERDEVGFSVPDPDLGLGLYAGETGPAGRHRPWAVWTDLADLLDAHLLIGRREAGKVRLTLRPRAGRLDTARDYSAGSEFARIDKLEDPVLLFTLVEALRRAAPPEGGRVLALGVGSGRELDALTLAFPGRRLEVLGLDLDTSALAAAQVRHPGFTFQQRDIGALPAELGRFDLVLALSVLQSRDVSLDGVLRTLHRSHLNPSGGLVLGFPNARYSGGEVSYGARLRNFARPDLSLLFADVAQARRYLHKHGFKVFVTGKHEVLVTAIPAGATTPAGLDL